MIASWLINLTPVVVTITGSKIIFLALILLSDLVTASITFEECSIPILIASGFISLEVYSICFEISLTGIFTIERTPVVFWAVRAVIAVIAYDPNEVTVLISAWIPAPPDESDPAIISNFDFIFN